MNAISKVKTSPIKELYELFKSMDTSSKGPVSTIKFTNALSDMDILKPQDCRDTYEILAKILINEDPSIINTIITITKKKK